MNGQQPNQPMTQYLPPPAVAPQHYYQQPQPQPQPQQPQAGPAPAPNGPAAYGFTPQQGGQPGGSRLTLAGEEILDGAGLPPELRGRRVSEVVRIYNALADDFITRQRAGGGRPPQGQRQPQSQGQQPVQQPLQGGQPPAEGQSFWQNPDQRITEVVQRVVGEAVAPFRQQTLETQSRSARQMAQERIPDFRELEADIMEVVKGSSQEALASIDYWENAADLARGRRYRRAQGQGQGQGQPQGGQPGGISPVAPYGPSGVPAVGAGYPQPVPPQPAPQVPQAPQYNMPGRPQTHQFFTESGGAPSVYAGTHGEHLSAAEANVAKLAGMTPQDYVAWRNVQRAQGAAL